MAYYDDGYMWGEEHTPSFPVAYQDPVSFSNDESYGVDTDYDAYNVSVFHDSKFIDHHDYRYNYSYDCGYGYDYDYGKCRNWCTTTDLAVNYFAHNYMEPKLNLYEPGYASYHSQHSISYVEVNSGFNDPEFEEYDPTPYGGGYDIISVYGKPLPPSDQTCYPRSKQKPSAPTPTPTPTPTPKSQPPHVVVPIAPPIPLAEPEPEPEPKPKPEPMPVANPIELVKVGEREKEEYTYPNYGYDYPWPEYDHGNAAGVGYDYGYGKQVVQIPPCEYSTEVVDLCENIFGSWPCLARIRKQEMCIENKSSVTCNEDGQLSPWEECANYIFGRSIAPYSA